MPPEFSRKWGTEVFFAQCLNSRWWNWTLRFILFAFYQSDEDADKIIFLIYQLSFICWGRRGLGVIRVWLKRNVCGFNPYSEEWIINSPEFYLGIFLLKLKLIYVLIFIIYLVLIAYHTPTQAVYDEIWYRILELSRNV